MPTNVIMPALGVAQKTGTLLKWLKAEGETVAKGEPLMEVETDKATVEIEAPVSGLLSGVSARAGDEVPVGQPIALILAAGETPPADGRNMGAASVSMERRSPARSAPAPVPALVVAPSQGRILASPAARRIARERGVALAAIRGSGPGGSILAKDVPCAVKPPAGLSVARAAETKLLPLSAMRRMVGARMAQSKQTAPHFYLSMDVDMSAVERLRAEMKQGGGAVSINDYILCACARALTDFPAMNASFSEEGLEQHESINLGLAVALEEGLVVPVIRNADKLTLQELAEASRRLIDKAQTKKLLPLDYEGGTFTVSNLGMLGVDSFTAIINPPQCAILACGRVAPRVVVEEDMLAIKALMTVTLSADHRIVDGAIAARFLTRIKRHLESGEF